MMRPFDLAQRLFLGLAIACLAGCQTTSSPYPLFSIPGVTRITPPASWQGDGVAVTPDLSNPTGADGGLSNPPAIRDPDAFQGARLKWKPYSSQGDRGSAVVTASYNDSFADQPVGSGVQPAFYQAELAQPPTRRPGSLTVPARNSGGWSSRHEPQATGQ